MLVVANPPERPRLPPPSAAAISFDRTRRDDEETHPIPGTGEGREAFVRWKTRAVRGCGVARKVSVGEVSQVFSQVYRRIEQNVYPRSVA